MLGAPRNLGKWRSIFLLLAVVITFRILIMNFGLWTQTGKPHPTTLEEAWNRWDSIHYVTIADKGYRSPEYDKNREIYYSVYAPLFPATIGLIKVITRLPSFWAAVSIALLCHLLSLILLYRLSENFFVPILFAAYPGAFYATTAYSDSFFIFLVLLYFHFMRSRALWAGTLVLSLIILARIPGVVMLPVHLLFVYRTRSWAKSLLFLLPPVMMLFYYFAASYYRYNDPFFFLTATKSLAYTYQIDSFPFAAAIRSIINLAVTPSKDLFWNTGMSAIVLFVVTATVIAGWKRLCTEYRLFCLCYLLLFASGSWNMGNLRYLYAVFPAFFIWSAIQTPWRQTVLVSLFLILQICFSARFASGWFID